MVDFSNYKTPVQIIESTVETFEKEMQKNLDDQIMQAIKKVGVVVDKEELIKAMAYDRRQYAAGYEDGYKKAVEDYKQCIEILEKAYKEQNYKEHEQILYFAKEIAEHLLGESETNKKVRNIISFLKERYPGGIEMFDHRVNSRDLVSTIYRDGLVTIEFCLHHEYVGIFGLSDEEFKIVEKECGKEHEHPMEWSEELKERMKGYNKAIDDFSENLKNVNFSMSGAILHFLNGDIDLSEFLEKISDEISEHLKGVKQNDD